MAESNNSKILQSSFYEIDILEIGGHHKGKRGKTLKISNQRF